jgi:transposase-like protein
MSIEQLAAKVAALPANARGRRRYPTSLQRQILMALAQSGLRQKTFADRLGMSVANLAKWHARAPRAKAQSKTAAFKRVIATESSATAVFSLRAPGGVVLEGLTAEAAADLIAALARRPTC